MVFYYTAFSLKHSLMEINKISSIEKAINKTLIAKNPKTKYLKAQKLTQDLSPKPQMYTKKKLKKKTNTYSSVRGNWYYFIINTTPDNIKKIKSFLILDPIVLRQFIIKI